MHSNGPLIILSEDPPYFSYMSIPSLIGDRMPRERDRETDGSTTSLVSSDSFAQILHTFLPYRIFCTRKNIQCKDVILEDEDISKALIKYASHSKIEHLVLGTKTGLLRRLKATDIPRSVAEGAPDFCTVYSIANGKIHSMKSASRPAPSITQSNLNMRGSDKRISMEALRKQANVRPSFLRGRMTLNNEWDIMWQEENGCSRVKVAVKSGE
ncbi:U-box domain-containing protein 52 [Senna tora]|uniref:RING-type E3 ubiquitin transferase n=1 Tax=Senna tora TaxID=362788 RepID=A0A834TY72_9FABA|nr:U-box domain-containing protein 52 [Senna tora]